MPSFEYCEESNSSPSSRKTATPQIPSRTIHEVFGDGDFEVGIDIEPGTYLSVGYEPHITIWKRLRDFTGDGVICSGGGIGPCVVTILPTDKGLKATSVEVGSESMRTRLEEKSSCTRFIAGILRLQRSNVI